MDGWGQLTAGGRGVFLILDSRTAHTFYTSLPRRLSPLSEEFYVDIRISKSQKQGQGN